MEVRTFRAATLQEALQKVRETMGDDASVLHTRELRHSRLGLFPKRIVEVEASLDVPVVSRFQAFGQHGLDTTNVPEEAGTRRTPSDVGKSQPSTSPRQGEITPSEYAQNEILKTGSAGDTSRRFDVERTVRRNMPPNLTPAMFDVLSHMLTAGIEPQTAKALLEQACEHCGDAGRNQVWLLQSTLCHLLTRQLRCAPAMQLSSDEQKVVALVGPTGVGKTTTLAKIAAGFRYEHGSQIGLITLDTFRLGAVDQLLQYAELISAPLEVVSSPAHVTGALQRLRECDLVLLDTAGRAPKDAEQLSILADFLHAADPDAVHLVVSATSSKAHVRDAIMQFSALQPTSLAITKLDEAVAFGEWLDVLRDSHLPISYLTAGQHVPQDIRVASSAQLASLLLGGAGQASPSEDVQHTNDPMSSEVTHVRR